MDELYHEAINEAINESLKEAINEAIRTAGIKVVHAQNWGTDIEIR